MANIDIKYEAWKNKLLDMGKRNRLLNYRETARSTVAITAPECGELYDMFVKKEQELIFPLIERIKTDEDGNTIQIIADHNIETNRNVTDLQKTLRNLRSKANTAIEEQGINVLYLSFGFLQWTEAEHSNYQLTSPLVLVPVTLSVDSLTSPYKLSLHEDEIVINPTLAYKLENDFAITLPAFSDDCDIEKYLDEIEKIAAPQNWTVNRNVGLSMLSFQKINMYNDLDKHKDSIVAHPIVRAISGDVDAAVEIPAGLSDYDFDKNDKPTNVFQVVDADASQQEAILLAKKGVSFVLQGPPGTGKSQTITNIIAESLADGKKVLFVSEKMAALDVVHRRLTGAGLDDFCLVLHSHKANKRNVLDQLDKTLRFTAKKTTLTDEAFQKLDTLQADKEKLNEYATQVYTTIEPLGKSIYEANGIVANLSVYDDVIFSIDNIRAIGREQYNKYGHLLTQFAATIGKMTDDYQANPWRDSNLSFVSNEFRHDATAHISSLLPKIDNASRTLAEIATSLCLDIPYNVQVIDSLAEILRIANKAYKIPAEWILTDELQPLFAEIAECAELKQQLLDSRPLLSGEYATIRASVPQMNISDTELLNTSNELLQEEGLLRTYISANAPYALWSIQELPVIEQLLAQAAALAKTIHQQKTALLETYEPQVFELDYQGLLARIKTEYTSFTKIFKKEYKDDKKAIQLCHRDIVKKITDEEMLSLAEQLRQLAETRKWYDDNAEQLQHYFGEDCPNEHSDYSVYYKQLVTYKAINNAIGIIGQMKAICQRVSEREFTLREHYRFLYNGILSDWDSIREAWNWAVNFKTAVANADVSEIFIKKVCQADDFIAVCRQAEEKLDELKRSISFEYEWFVGNFSNRDIFDNMELSALHKRMDACMNGLSLLEEWIDFRTAKSKCIVAGLGDVVRAIEEYNIPSQNIVPIFKKRFFRLWLDAVLPSYPAVLNFRRRNQEETIHEFASLDKMQFEIAKARIKTKLISELPSMEHFTTGLDELSILRRELNKQKRIMPIRRLFQRIPNLLLTLKPCLMMSPLSVSLFLEAETYQFDIVIFDEASQVCTENAIGAISRGKQVVIAGDSKQLPPTNFFQAAVSDSDFDDDNDFDEYDDINAYESILDEANILPERTLRWHYRSRHESLIAFSNAKIYKNNLITFPSNIEKAANNGVEYIYVQNGYYDTGGRKGNITEANKVADLVFEHFKTQPNRTLGVIAFGEVQQQAIETVLRERRLQNQEFESFFAEDTEEAFFVKNLENVQGDERDTIIFSIGYAKDANGVFRMNFGPLSKAGGERRLNVAITRAKYNIKLVGSIMPTDINTDRISSEGTKLLRTYIDFAINGPEVLQREITESDIVEHDSPFEEAVYNFLDRRGYKLATQVGCSGYRIDMAVKHPTLSGIYVLGIECDGAAYHSARTARERDRLRQDVLENMGWKIYRIWSTDWIKDPVTEGQRLIAAVEDAISSYGIPESLPNELSSLDEQSVAVHSPTMNDFVNVEDKADTVDNSENPYGFATFESVDDSNYTNIREYLTAIINNEYPIHYELLCQRLAPQFGRERATSTVRHEVDRLLLNLKGTIKCKDDFIFPADYSEIVVKMPNNRKIQHISTEELAAAMLHILPHCVGTTKASLCTETMRAYGFNRSSAKITTAMQSAVDLLIETDKIEEVEGKLKIKR